MAFVYKILGQLRPSDTSAADIYTVPSNTQTVVSSILVCNTTSTAATFSVFQRTSGSTAGEANAIAFDQNIPANSTTTIEAKLTISETNILSVKSGTSSALTFTVNGSEITD
jgi:hypothetical protein